MQPMQCVEVCGILFSAGEMSNDVHSPTGKTSRYGSTVKREQKLCDARQKGVRC